MESKEHLCNRKMGKIQDQQNQLELENEDLKGQLRTESQQNRQMKELF